MGRSAELQVNGEGTVLGGGCTCIDLSMDLKCLKHEFSFVEHN